MRHCIVENGDCKNGFTLIELAIVILIAGILFAGAAGIAAPLMMQSRLVATQANMNRVIEVLSAYAQRNHRIPCPANPNSASASEPYGAERGSGIGGTQVGSCNAGAAEGIVPFLTLGLKPGDVKDGYGRFLTYRVSPVFARDTTQPFLAHKRCRTEQTWVTEGASRNPTKARFCCPDLGFHPGTDIIIRDDNGRPLWPFGRDTAGISYDAASTVHAGSNAFDVAADNVTAIAFVLVSHGPNGFGAYQPDGTRQLPGGAAFHPHEQENWNGNNVFVMRPFSTAIGGFDDLLVWRTQDQIYAQTGAGSCAFP